MRTFKQVLLELNSRCDILMRVTAQPPSSLQHEAGLHVHATRVLL